MVVITKSGKEVPLLRPPPLRTVRASFPAYGSSLYKAFFLYKKTGNQRITGEKPAEGNNGEGNQDLQSISHDEYLPF